MPVAPIMASSGPVSPLTALLPMPPPAIRVGFSAIPADTGPSSVDDLGRRGSLPPKSLVSGDWI